MKKLLPVLLLAATLFGCDDGASRTTTRVENDPRDLTYAAWKRETEAGRGDSLARMLTREEVDAISAGINSHKGDTAAVAVLTMRELIALGRDLKKRSSGRTH